MCLLRGGERGTDWGVFCVLSFCVFVLRCFDNDDDDDDVVMMVLRSMCVLINTKLIPYEYQMSISNLLFTLYFSLVSLYPCRITI